MLTSLYMIQKTLLFILTVLVFQSCNLGASKTWKGDSIDKEKREQIKILNDKLFQAIIRNDVNGVRNLMSDKLLEVVNADFDKLINQVSSSFKSESYRILDEYMVQNSKTDIRNTLLSGNLNDDDYVLSYQALNKEMYVSLLVPNGLDNELLFTVIYGNYDNQWKINIIQFGQYSFFRKSAPAYYTLAKDCYKKAYLIDAITNIELAKQCLRPSNDFFQYRNEKEINEFYDDIMKEANSKYSFPMALEQVDTKPEVFRIFPEMGKDAFFPMVLYLSDINLKDTVRLKVEYEKVKKEVNRIFTGINKDKKFVFYRIFNKIPHEHERVEYYGFIDRSTE